LTRFLLPPPYNQHNAVAFVCVRFLHSRQGSALPRLVRALAVTRVPFSAACIAGILALGRRCYLSNGVCAPVFKHSYLRRFMLTAGRFGVRRTWDGGGPHPLPFQALDNDIVLPSSWRPSVGHYIAAGRGLVLGFSWCDGLDLVPCFCFSALAYFCSTFLYFQPNPLTLVSCCTTYPSTHA